MKPKKKPCLVYAMNYIYHYPKTEVELKAKLLQKGYEEEIVDKTMEALREKGFLNDTQFVDSYIHGEIVRKGKPIYNVKQKLLQKGADEDLIDRVLAEYADDVQEGVSQKIIKEISKLKTRGIEGVDVVQRLARRGYSFDQIKEAVEMRDSKNNEDS